MSTERADTTSFEDGVKTSVQGFPAWNGRFSGFWDDTEDYPYAGQESADGVKIYLYPSLDAVSKYFYGPAWVDYSLTLGTNAAAAVSGTFVANGAVGRK